MINRFLSGNQTKSGLVARGLAAALLCAGPMAAAGTAEAASRLNGLTVAVSADGSQVIAGGDTRTLLTIDPKTLEVKKRMWIGTAIVNMAFNGDGSVLVVQDTADTAFLYDTKTWKPKFTLQKFGDITVLPKFDLLIGVENSYRGALVKFKKLSDTSDQGQIQMERKERVRALGIDASGKKLAVLLQADNDKNEPKVKFSEIPRELRGVERAEYRQRNDGRTSVLRIYSVPDGKMIKEVKTYFDLRGPGHILLDGDKMTIIGRSNHGAVLNGEGDGKMFQTANQYNYASNLSQDRKIFFTGGSNGTFSATDANSLKSLGRSRLNRLPGLMEYFTGIDATADNSAVYAGTSAYRVVKADGKGKIQMSKPVK